MPPSKNDVGAGDEAGASSEARNAPRRRCRANRGLIPWIGVSNYFVAEYCRLFIFNYDFSVI
jgi:hypothetical protein